MRTRNYNFDIDKHSLIKPVVIIRSGDHDIDTIRVTLSEQGDPVDLTKATVTFMGTTPAGNKIIDDAHVKIVDATTGIFEYTFPSATGASVGEYQDAYFSIIMGNGQTSTMNFRIQVLSGVDISAPAASDYVTNFNTMVVNLNSAYDSATAATNTKMAAAVSSVATSAASVLDSALARVATVNSQANNASSTANNAVSMASSVASTVTSQATYINSVASSAAADVNRALDKINNLSIGGRNLYLNSRTLPDSYNLNGGATVTTEPFDSTTNMWHIVAPQGSGGGVGIYIFQYGKGKLSDNSNWSYSADIKGTGKVAVFGIENGNSNGIKGTVGSEWSRISDTGYISNPSYKTLVMYFDTTDSPLDVYIKLPKLETGNVPTDWTPAPEDADNTFLKKSNKLPDEAHDFAVIASDTNKYQGTWYTDGTAVANGPTDNWNWNSIEVIGGFGNGAGIIRTAGFGYNQEYITTVNSGKIVGWKQVANDTNVVHNTGTETIGGLKTFVQTPVSLDNNSTTIEDAYTRITVIKVRGVVSVGITVKAVTPNNGSYYIDLPTWANSNALYENIWIYLSTQPNASGWNVSVRLNGGGNRVTRIGFNASTPIGFAYTNYSA